MRRVGGLLLTLVAAVACTPEGAEPPPDAIASEAPSSVEPTPSETPTPEETLDLTARCEGLGRVPARGQITFVKNGTLMATRPDGTRARCLVDVSEVVDMAGFFTAVQWGPRGDRVIVGASSVFPDGTTYELVERPRREDPSWSRPTGQSAIYVSEDGRRLLKSSAQSGAPIDISFLRRHEYVTYHPSGTHIAVVGRDFDGTYGIFFATNLGQEARLIARGEKARRVGQLVFSHDGDHLFFVAEHPNKIHLHELILNTDSETGVTDLQFKTLKKFGAGFTTPTLSAFHARRVASAYGDCSAGKGNLYLSGPGTKELAVDDPVFDDYSLGPVGWLPNGDLVAIAYAAGFCATQSDLYVISNDGVTLIARNVQGSDVRLRLPPAPDPPGETSEVIA